MNRARIIDLEDIAESSGRSSRVGLCPCVCEECEDTFCTPPTERRGSCLAAAALSLRGLGPVCRQGLSQENNEEEQDNEKGQRGRIPVVVRR